MRILCAGAQARARNEIRTNFSPKWDGANSTARTVPLASTSIARSAQREADALDDAPPSASGAAAETCSQTLTVRSNDAVARIVPNSGCAQLTFEIAASCACG